MTPAEQLKESILTLQTQITEANPLMPTLLRTIHTQIRADAALVTTLSEEDISIIVSGLKKQTMTDIATALMKSKTKSIKQIGIGDL